MTQHGEWREASKREHCPICDKPDWCSITGPVGAVEAVVCMREESENARPNGGWFHRIRESANSLPPIQTSAPKTFATAHDAVAALERNLGRHSHVWKYFKATGEPVGVVVRWNRDGEKDIRPVSRVAGGWIIGAMPEPRPLYQLPEVSAVSGVFICEGEKAADAIRSLDLTATTSSGGSAAAAKTDWSPLAGKSLILLPDNDQPGEKYASAVTTFLAGLNPQPTLKIVRLPGLPDKGDAADWIAAGGTREQLDGLVSKAEQVALQVALPVVKTRKPKQQLLVDAAQAYINRMRDGKVALIETGIPELDYALGGGLEKGEMVITAARTSHGKSTFALQSTHHWTAAGLPVLIISEEMSALALGKRTLQFASSVPQEHWQTSADALERHLAEYKSGRATCIVSEPCITPKAVVESIEANIDEHGIQAVVVDYCQLLHGDGRSKYEQVSHVSNTLRQAASRLNVLLLAVCQLNREVEKRAKFIPCVADIRDAGTLEQDADVILLFAWPHKVDSKQPANQYQIFVAKNRNRAILQPLVVCRFDPSRQTITESTVRGIPNYEPAFEDDPFAQE